VLVVAKDCIGKVLVHRSAEGEIAGRIVEAEAYRGPADRAAHSFGGRRTERTEAMFGPPGHAYVFFVYGMHYHFNIVTGETGEPHAVLVRAVEPLWGVELMAARRAMSPDRIELTNGPGKLCAAFGITRAQYAADLCKNELYLRDGPRTKIGRATRIGVDYAGAWAQKPWRFYEIGNPYVSRLPRRK
jgi:DNA-3-methyladenine glycosylase